MTEEKRMHITRLLGSWEADSTVPNGVILEVTGACTGGCTYCYSDSTGADSGQTIPTEKLKEVVRQAKEIGAQGIYWCGGDPLLHPDIFPLMEYLSEVGLTNFGLSTNPATLTRRAAKRLVELQPEEIGIHIDSLRQEVYNRINSRPESLKQKIQGYRNLLEAGYPPRQVWGQICLSQKNLETVEETVDWFLDEMGAGFVNYIPLRPQGLAQEGMGEYELSLSDQRRAFEYRARKLNDPLLAKMGSSDSRACCQNHFYVKNDGSVTPCSLIRDYVVGNIYQESLADIFARERDLLMFRFEIQGMCGQCESNDICFGCRANAWNFAGDIRASDPKCWRIPQNTAEYVWQEKDRRRVSCP